MMPYQQLVFPASSRYGYSNPGFVYLARVIEAITGDPWTVYVQKNIFAPLGLSRSYVGTTPYYLARHRSHSNSTKKPPTACACGPRPPNSGAWAQSLR